MNAKQLRSSILQAAVQGKLVDQNPHDEPASLLVERIAEEKNRLIKEKKIKKPKSTSRIFRKEGKFYESVNGAEPVCIDDKLPFEIPESWEWVRLGEVCQINPRNQLDNELEVGFVPMNLIKDGFENQHDCIKKTWKEIKSGFTHFKNGDIAIAKITPCFQNRKSVIISNLPNDYGSGTTELYILRTYKNTIKSLFILNIVKSVYFIESGKKKFSGTAGQQRISTNFISSFLIPIPPLAEQDRIVQKIEELVPFIQEYDTKEQSLRQLHQAFPQQLKKSILQAGIQGKLVPQDKNDESASVLLDQIAKEKAQLIKEKKIKKPKSTSRIFRKEGKFYESINGCEAVCIDDKLPFDIPESWEWARLGEFVDIRDGTHDTPKYVASGIPLVTSKNISNGYVDTTNCKFISIIDHIKISERSKVDIGDILFAMIGSIGNPVKIVCEPNYSVKNVAIFKPYVSENNMSYIHIYLKYIQNIWKAQAKGGVQSFVSLNFIRTYFFPIPPLNEQKRIVKEIEMLLEKIERLP